MKFLETLCRQFSELKIQGAYIYKEGLTFLQSLHAGALPGLHGEYWRRIPPCFWLGMEKQSDQFEIFHSFYYWQGLPPGKPFYQSLICWVLSESNLPREREILNSSSIQLSFLAWSGGKNEKHLVIGHRITKRQTNSKETLECLPITSL